MTRRKRGKGATPAPPKRIPHRRSCPGSLVLVGAAEDCGRRRPLRRRRRTGRHRRLQCRRNRSQFQSPGPSSTVRSCWTTKRWKSIGEFRIRLTVSLLLLLFRPVDRFQFLRNRVWSRNGPRRTSLFGLLLRQWLRLKSAGRKSSSNLRHFRPVTTAFTLPDCHLISGVWRGSETAWRYRTTSGTSRTSRPPSRPLVPTTSGRKVAIDRIYRSIWRTRAFRSTSIRTLYSKRHRPSSRPLWPPEARASGDPLKSSNTRTKD